MEIQLTHGSVFKTLIKFSLPFLFSNFLQTLYGMADLFIAGQFNGAEIITAVAVGSQIMHMITVIIIGLSMGATVLIGRAVGENNPQKIEDLSVSEKEAFESTQELQSTKEDLLQLTYDDTKKIMKSFLNLISSEKIIFNFKCKPSKACRI